MCAEHASGGSRFLLRVGWVERVKATSTRANPKFTEMRMVSDAELQRMYHELRELMNQPKAFVRAVFRTTDNEWFNRCFSLMAEPEESGMGVEVEEIENPFERVRNWNI